ncbi:uncharacterized protein LOC119432894 isoform X2 [Dermacentor silvarum]|uniref:uncharacterized protein LOC119432894 isoform X2 n=1 Tax=Dermacentor silvarum TaxID=543639 RepID=UPI002101CE3A|nr:uncharacterized protein LOC119432894 isoform X2 [Dermacentor silvarum]
MSAGRYGRCKSNAHFGRRRTQAKYARRLADHRVRANQLTTGSTEHRIWQLHFEPSQYEQRRVDGWKKLKQNAIPTLFAYNTKPLKQQTEQESHSKRRKKRPKVPQGKAAINNHSEANHKPEALMSFCEVVLAYESYSSGTGSTTVTIHQIAKQGEPLTSH